MEKQVRRFKVKFDLDWEYGVEISKLREDLDAIEKLGATHVEIEAYTSYDCAGVTIECFVDRYETDEECLERTEKQTARENSIKLNELEQLKRLKAKYKQ